MRWDLYTFYNFLVDVFLFAVSVVGNQVYVQLWLPNVISNFALQIFTVLVFLHQVLNIILWTNETRNSSPAADSWIYCSSTTNHSKPQRFEMKIRNTYSYFKLPIFSGKYHWNGPRNGIKTLNLKKLFSSREMVIRNL